MKKGRYMEKGQRSLLKGFRYRLSCAGILFLLCLYAPDVYSQQGPEAVPGDLTLTQAFMCEEIKEDSPVNPGAVFSCGIGKVICLTTFAASRKNTVYHSWFHKGQLSNKQKLIVNPPEWTAASSIQLREADKGPWQVEVSDGKDRILKVLRFSIVD